MCSYSPSKHKTTFIPDKAIEGESHSTLLESSVLFSALVNPPQQGRGEKCRTWEKLGSISFSIVFNDVELSPTI